MNYTSQEEAQVQASVQLFAALPPATVPRAVRSAIMRESEIPSGDGDDYVLTRLPSDDYKVVMERAVRSRRRRSSAGKVASATVVLRATVVLDATVGECGAYETRKLSRDWEEPGVKSHWVTRINEHAFDYQRTITYDLPGFTNPKEHVWRAVWKWESKKVSATLPLGVTTLASPRLTKPRDRSF